MTSGHCHKQNLANLQTDEDQDSIEKGEKGKKCRPSDTFYFVNCLIEGKPHLQDS